MSVKEKININKIPRHVAIIMDGNGRWAKKKGNSRIFGHKNGVAAVRDTVEAAGNLQVKHLTLYAFSTENWNRPKSEINALMTLLVHSINNELSSLNKNNVRLSTIGDIQRLPSIVQTDLKNAIAKTKDNTGLNLILALSYSSRWEIINAIKKIAYEIKAGAIDIENIHENEFEQYLETKQIPDPELLIRTSGELRISNFMLYQLAYTELYFTEKLWPDFRKEDFFEAIYDYQQRERRFGKTSEQIEKRT